MSTDIDGRTPLPDAWDDQPIPRTGMFHVKFGPGPTQEIPLEWAETMLTRWREKAPRQFGEALAAAAMEAR